jgi:hypothetical protein
MHVAQLVEAVDLHDDAAERVGVATGARELDAQRVLDLRVGEERRLRAGRFHGSSRASDGRGPEFPPRPPDEALHVRHFTSASQPSPRSEERREGKEKSFPRGRGKLSCISTSIRSEMAVGEGKDSDRRKDARRNELFDGCRVGSGFCEVAHTGISDQQGAEGFRSLRLPSFRPNDLAHEPKNL